MSEARPRPNRRGYFRMRQGNIDGDTDVRVGRLDVRPG
jgi:hypothetical protein